jgi:hypothetical protein
MTGLERTITKVCNAVDVALQVPTVGQVFAESWRLESEEIARREEEFRFEQSRKARRRMIRASCE